MGIVGAFGFQPKRQVVGQGRRTDIGNAQWDQAAKDVVSTIISEQPRFLELETKPTRVRGDCEGKFGVQAQHIEAAKKLLKIGPQFSTKLPRTMMLQTVQLSGECFCVYKLVKEGLLEGGTGSPNEMASEKLLKASQERVFTQQTKKKGRLFLLVERAFLNSHEQVKICLLFGRGRLWYCCSGNSSQAAFRFGFRAGSRPIPN